MIYYNINTAIGQKNLAFSFAIAGYHAFVQSCRAASLTNLNLKDKGSQPFRYMPTFKLNIGL